MLDMQVLGALACAAFAGWQIGDMLRPMLRRIGALPAIPPYYEGPRSVALPASEWYQSRAIAPPALRYPAEHYLRLVNR